MAEYSVGSLTLGLEISFIAIIYALVVLTTLVVIIKAATYVVRPRMPPKAVQAEITAPEEVGGLSEEEVALAITAIHKYLAEKGVGKSARHGTGLSSSPWVTSWRMECGSHGDYISFRKGK